MKLTEQPKHFRRLAQMHSADFSPAKARHYECLAQIAEHKLEIAELEQEAKDVLTDAGYENGTL